MNEAMKMENIQEYFENIGKTVDKNIVFGYVGPRKRDYFFWGALSAFKQKSYLIAFYPDEIIMVQLTAMGKFSDEQLIIIPKEAIDSMTVKKGFMQYKIVIHTVDQQIKLKCNKFILKTPWQKENTTYLEEIGWYWNEPV